jgi:hypothetical protein
MSTPFNRLLFGREAGSTDPGVPSLLDLLFGQAGVTTPDQEAAIQQAEAQARQALEELAPAPLEPFPPPEVSSPAPPAAGPVTVRTVPLTPQNPLAARLALHPNPLDLIHAWIATESPGIVALVYVSVPTLVKAQSTATYTQNVPPGTVLVQAEPLAVHSTYYAPGLLVTLEVDDYLITENFALTASTASTLAEWTYTQRMIRAIYQNTTWHDATVTNRGKGVAMRADVFWKVWMPLFQATVSIWEQWAQRVNGPGTP